MLGYSIGFIFCCAAFAIGKYMATKPETAERIFSWAPGYAGLYFRYAGRFFFGVGIVGMAFYLVLLSLLVVHHI